MPKFILTFSLLLVLPFVFAASPESSTLPINKTLNLPDSLDLSASRTMNMLMNPKNNEPELAIFTLKAGLPHFTGQIATVADNKLVLESSAIGYFPFTNGTVPGICNFNSNGTTLCFHANSLVLEDNSIVYQLNTGSSMIHNKLDTEVMGASIKFFAATEFAANNLPIRYTGISNDTYKQQLAWLDCGATTSCKQKKINTKPPASSISAFQIINNQLYFVINYNTIVQLDIATGTATTKLLNVYNITAFAVAKDSSIYVINSVRNVKMPNSFGISKCSFKDGDCQPIYIENSNPSRYSRLFLGVDSQSLYLIANKSNDNIRGANKLILVSISKNNIQAIK